MRKQGNDYCRDWNSDFLLGREVSVDAGGHTVPGDVPFPNLRVVYVDVSFIISL